MQNTASESLYGRRDRLPFNLIINVLLIAFISVVAFELILFNVRYVNVYVDGGSMLPTLNSGDYVFANTKATPEYGDIVVVEVENTSGRRYYIIKRLIAFGGDTVRLDHGQLEIKYAGEDDFTKIDEEYLEHYTPDASWNNFSDHVVAEGCIFLLGDNRDDSKDSRVIGDIPLSALEGVVSQWSFENKSMITVFYTFFKITLPKAFGFK